MLRLFRERREFFAFRRLQRFRSPGASGDETSEHPASVPKVLDFGTVRRRTIEPCLVDLSVRQGKSKALAKPMQGFVIELLLLVRGHPALGPTAQPEAFLRLCEDYSRLTRMQGRSTEGSVYFH